MILGLTILIGCAGALFIGALFALCAAFAAVLAAVVVMLLVKEPLRIRIYAAVMLVSLAASLCWFAHKDTQYRKLLALGGENVTLSGTVENIEYTGAGKRRYIVRGSVEHEGEVIDGVCFGLYYHSTDGIYLFDDIVCEVEVYDGDGGYEQRLIDSGELRLSGYVARLVSASPAGSMSLKMRINGIRTRISEGIRRILPDYRGGLLSEITVGLSGITAEDTVYEDFRAAGISHILVISGAHLMIAVSTVMALMDAVGIGKRWAAGTAAVFVVGYIFLAGAGASIVRAGIMMLFVTAGTLIGRRSDGLTSISFAAAVIVIAKPLSLLTASMWLSFSAALGIMLLSGRISQGITKLLGRLPCRRIVGAAAGTVGASVSAWIFVTPVSILLFDEFSFYSVLVNFVVAPLLTPLVALGMLTGLLSLIDPAFFPARLCGKLAGALLSLIRLAARAASALPFSRVYAGERFVKLWVIASAALLLLVILLKPRENGRYLALAGVISAFALIVSASVNAVLMRGTVKLTVSSLYNGSAVTASCRGRAVTVANLEGASDASLLSAELRAVGTGEDCVIVFEDCGEREAAKLFERTKCAAAIIDDELAKGDLLCEFAEKLHPLKDGVTAEAAGGMISACRMAEGVWLIEAQQTKILYITEDFDIEELPAADTDIDILVTGDGAEAENADRLRNELGISIGYSDHSGHGETQVLDDDESVEVLLSGGEFYTVTRR